MKDKIKHFIWKNLIGYPSDTRNLLNYIESLEGDFCIYLVGDYSFGIKKHLNDSEESDEILSFATAEERNAFEAGLKYGVTVMGGESEILPQKDLESIKESEEMNKISTVFADPNKIH